jgi:hypothetical protein
MTYTHVREKGASCRNGDLFGHGAKLRTNLPESETPGNFKSLRENLNSHSTLEIKNANHNNTSETAAERVSCERLRTAFMTRAEGKVNR